MNLRVIPQNAFNQPIRIGFYTSINSDVRLAPMLKIKRVWKAHKRKAISYVYAELVHVEGEEGIKIVLPQEEVTEMDNEPRCKKGHYFMGEIQIELTNARILGARGQGYIVYDFNIVE